MSTREWRSKEDARQRRALIQIEHLLSQIPTPDNLDLDYEDEWERGRMIGEAMLAQKLRTMLRGEVK